MTAEYAVLAVLWLARQGGAPRTVREIAQATDIPAGYLAKILRRLVRHDLIYSRRGPRGGFALVKDPNKLTTLEVIEVADPRPARSAIWKDRFGVGLLQRELGQVHQSFEDTLRRISFADLLEEADELGDIPRG